MFGPGCGISVLRVRIQRPFEVIDGCVYEGLSFLFRRHPKAYALAVQVLLELALEGAVNIPGNIFRPLGRGHPLDDALERVPDLRWLLRLKPSRKNFTRPYADDRVDVFEALIPGALNGLHTDKVVLVEPRPRRGVVATPGMWDLRENLLGGSLPDDLGDRRPGRRVYWRVLFPGPLLGC